MLPNQLFETAGASLIRTHELLRGGLRERDIASMQRVGELFRVRRGYYVRQSTWDDALPELRHAIAIVAAHRATHTGPVFSHRSASVVHGWPVWSAWLTHAPGNPRQVQTISAVPGAGKLTATRQRHLAALDDDDIVLASPAPGSNQLQHTSPERTLFDLARAEPFSVALVAADAHLHETASTGRKVDALQVAGWRARMQARSSAYAGRPGVRAVRMLARHADPWAESPLETISRLRFLQLGISVETQVSVPAPDGRKYFVDFYAPELGFWGECDGKSKYVGAEVDGHATAELLYAEKRRHDWIAGTTNLRGIRWGVREVLTRDRFARHLEAHGVAVPGLPSPLLEPETRWFLAKLP